MVKHSIYYVLLLSFFIGCSAGIVDPPPTTPGKAADYFWPADIASATYTQITGGARTSVTLNFAHDATTFTRVSDASSTPVEQFSYRMLGDSIILDHLAKNSSFIPLPNGFSLDTIATTYTTIHRKMKKVLVVDASTILALDHDGKLFITTNTGQTWQQLPWPYEGITAWAVERKAIFIGTEKGGLFTSSDLAMSWRTIAKGKIASKITKIVPVDTLGLVFYTTTDKSVFRALNIGSIVDSIDEATSDRLDDEVTSLAVTGSLQTYSICAGTASNGFWSAKIYPSYTDWTQGMPVWQKAHAMLAVSRKILFALAENNGNINLITSSNNGVNWSAAVNSTLEEKPTLLAFDGMWLTTASENGITNRYNSSSFAKQPLTLRAQVVFELSAAEGICAAATDSGIFIARTGSVEWQNISSGPLAETVKKETSTGNSLLLLRSDEHGLDSGTVWNAGTCYGKVNGYSVAFFITAKIHEHLTELSLVSLGGNKYNDVVPVQYFFSRDPGNTQIGADTPRMVIYYANGVGPVYIQQYIGKTLITELYRD